MSQEKILTIHNIQVTYKTAGEGQPILILHGWGSSSDSWVAFQNTLAAKGFQVIIPDLPGFGKTQAPQKIWGVEEYAELVDQFAEKLGLQKFVLAGHSFGGQTAIQYSLQHAEKVEKLILIAAAGIRHEPGIKTKALAAIAGVTPTPMKKMAGMIMGRSDYGRSKGVMKDIMRKVIRQDLESELGNITVPTLIIWGDKDKETPVQDAYTMRKFIPGSKLEVLSGIGHRVRNEAPKQLIEKISEFIA